MVAKCDDEAKNDSAPLARGDGESPRLSDRLCHFRAVRDERNASSPLPDAMRYELCRKRFVTLRTLHDGI